MKLRLHRQFVLRVAAGAATVLVPSMLCEPAAQAVEPRQCMYSVDGNCRPNWATWGYYQTQWRAWPTESAGPVTPPSSYAQPPHRIPSGIDVEVPTPNEELERIPELPATTLPGPQGIPATGGTNDPFRDESPSGNQGAAARSGRPNLTRAISDRLPSNVPSIRPNPVRSGAEGTRIPAAPQVPADFARGREVNPLRGDVAAIPIPSRNELTPVSSAPELRAPASEEIAPVTFYEEPQAKPQAEVMPIPAAAPAFRNPLRR